MPNRSKNALQGRLSKRDIEAQDNPSVPVAQNGDPGNAQRHEKKIVNHVQVELAVVDFDKFQSKVAR